MKASKRFLYFIMPVIFSAQLLGTGCNKKDSQPESLPAITDFTPKYGKRGDTVTITGRYFDNKAEVMMNGIKAVVTSNSETAIQFIIPNDTAVTGDKLTVKSNSFIVESNDDFELTNVWRRLYAGSPSPVWQPISFTWNNKIYFGLGQQGGNYSNTLDIYDPVTNTWSTGPTLPPGAQGREGAVAVVKGDKVYIGMGYAPPSYKSDWWEYSPALSGDAAWKRLADIPYNSDYYEYPGYGTAFVVKNRIFAGFGTNSRLLLEYLPATDTWSSNVNQYIDPRHYLASFVKNDVAYLGGGTSYSRDDNKFYSFDPDRTPNIKPIANYPGAFFTNPPTFDVNGDTYLLDPLFLFRFNAATEDWTNMETETPAGINKIHTVRNKVYGIGPGHAVYQYIPNRK